MNDHDRCTRSQAAMTIVLGFAVVQYLGAPDWLRHQRQLANRRVHAVEASVLMLRDPFNACRVPIAVRIEFSVFPVEPIVPSKSNVLLMTECDLRRDRSDVA